MSCSNNRVGEGLKKKTFIIPAGPAGRHWPGLERARFISWGRFVAAASSVLRFRHKNMDQSSEKNWNRRWISVFTKQRASFPPLGISVGIPASKASVIIPSSHVVENNRHIAILWFQICLFFFCSPSAKQTLTCRVSCRSLRLGLRTS